MTKKTESPTLSLDKSTWIPAFEQLSLEQQAAALKVWHNLKTVLLKTPKDRLRFYVPSDLSAMIRDQLTSNGCMILDSGRITKAGNEVLTFVWKLHV